MANGAEQVGEVGASGRVHDETRLEPDEKERQREVEDERDQKRQPPADIARRVRGTERNEGANVDEQIEPQHDSLSAVLRVLDDALAALEGDDLGHMGTQLIEQKRRDIGLEHGYTYFGCLVSAGCFPRDLNNI